MTANKHLLKADELLKEEAKLARYEFEDAHEKEVEASEDEGRAKAKYFALKAASKVVSEQLGDDAATDIFRGSPSPAASAKGGSSGIFRSSERREQEQDQAALGPAED